MSDPFNQQITNQVNPNGTMRPSELRKELCKQIHHSSTQLPLMIVQQLNNGLGQFWGSNFNPQDIANDLDTMYGKGFTAKLFELHAVLGTFVAQQVPAVATAIQKRPNFYEIAINADGSVTITEKAA